MGNCRSRFCCMAGSPENKSSKTAKSEKSALEMNCGPLLSSYAASNKLAEYEKIIARSKDVDEDTRKEYLRQIHRLVWKDINLRIMKARKVVLARRNNEVNQGASTSTANPSCNIPSSDEWLTYYPCLFDSIACSEEDDDDEVNCSQSSAAGHLIRFRMFLRNQEPEERERLRRLPQKTGPIDRDFSNPR